MLYTILYLLVVLSVFFSLYASAKVNLTFKKYAKVASLSGMTGAQAAQTMLNQAGVYNVQVLHTPGKLTDHYDPRTNAVYLSDSVYNSTSVAAVGVACHECGHAIQHATGYQPVVLRSQLVPVANIGAKLAWPLLVIGFAINSNAALILIDLGIILFSLSVLFQIVTLPVEFNASGRALAHIEQYGFLQEDELKKTRKVLRAAALTYVASAATSLLQLLRLIVLRGGRKRG